MANNPELTQLQMQLSKDLLTSLNAAMGKMQADILAATFQMLTQVATICTDLAASTTACCSALGIPPPSIALATTPTVTSEAAAFTGAMPVIGELILTLPGKIDNAISGALKQIQAIIEQLQFPEVPEDLSDLPEEEFDD